MPAVFTPAFIRRISAVGDEKSDNVVIHGKGKAEVINASKIPELVRGKDPEPDRTIEYEKLLYDSTVSGRPLQYQVYVNGFLKRSVGTLWIRDRDRASGTIGHVYHEEPIIGSIPYLRRLSRLNPEIPNRSYSFLKIKYFAVLRPGKGGIKTQTNISEISKDVFEGIKKEIKERRR